MFVRKQHPKSSTFSSPSLLLHWLSKQAGQTFSVLSGKSLKGQVNTSCTSDSLDSVVAATCVISAGKWAFVLSDKPSLNRVRRVFQEELFGHKCMLPNVQILTFIHIKRRGSLIAYGWWTTAFWHLTLHVWVETNGSLNSYTEVRRNLALVCLRHPLI